MNHCTLRGCSSVLSVQTAAFRPGRSRVTLPQIPLLPPLPFDSNCSSRYTSATATAVATRCLPHSHSSTSSADTRLHLLTLNCQDNYYTSKQPPFLSYGCHRTKAHPLRRLRFDKRVCEWERSIAGRRLTSPRLLCGVGIPVAELAAGCSLFIKGSPERNLSSLPGVVVIRKPNRSTQSLFNNTSEAEFTHRAVLPVTRSRSNSTLHPQPEESVSLPVDFVSLLSTAVGPRKPSQRAPLIRGQTTGRRGVCLSEQSLKFHLVGQDQLWTSVRGIGRGTGSRREFHLSVRTEMAKSKFEYVRQFETDDPCLPNCWIVVRIDGKAFHKFTDTHHYMKPNDERGLSLMTRAAQTVMSEFNEIVLSYGQSDEYSFVFHKNCKLYNRRASKIMTNVVSLFASSFTLFWPRFFNSQELQYPPSFDGRVVLYPSDDNLRDYLSWRQADCHINNLYNTCFWKLVQEKGLTPNRAADRLKGTLSSDKNELLYSEFNINYNNLPELFRKGSVLIRPKSSDSESPLPDRSINNHSRGQESKASKKPGSVVLHTDIIGKQFWEENPHILNPKL